MTLSSRRIGAIARKELREYRRNGSIIGAAAILPLIFLIQPLIQVFTLPVSASAALRDAHPLLYLLAVPVLVPAVLASYAVVGERLQGSLEPVLTTPVRREELLLGKATAVFLPAVVVAYLVFGLFVTVVELFAHPAVADALIRGPQLLAQLLFTPLLTAWSLWVGIAVSVRCRDPRTAAQLAILCSLPTVAVTTLLAFDIIPATTGVAIGLAVVLLVLIALGWRTATAIFDRERLIAGSR